MKRRLSAILAADMVGYSRLVEADEIGTIERQKTYLTNIFKPLIDQFHGRIVKLMGDGILVEFASVIDAVKCAVEIQRTVAKSETEIEPEQRISYRVGINLGDVLMDDGDIFGDGVNIAARLEQLAEPDSIYISGTVFDHLKSNIDVGYEALGEIKVKNIQHPIRTYKILSDSAVSGSTVEQPKSLPSQFRKAFFAIVILCILIISGGGFWLWNNLSTNPDNRTENETVTLNDREKITPGITIPSPDIPAIAVLPFNNMSGDENQEYFSDGMTDDLITDLSQISGLLVIARNSVFSYKGKAVKIQQIGRELNVDFVLEGSIRKAGDSVRINAQLVNVKTGGHLWAERYDRKLTNVFALQDEVTRKIVEALTIKLKSTENKRLNTHTQIHPEAYDALLRGLELYRRFTPETNLEARSLYEQAIAFEPDFARAHGALALTHAAEAARQWGDDPDKSNQRALEIAKHALSLDNSIPQVQFIFGAIYRNLMRIKDAIGASRRAISLDPNYADAYVSLGMNLNYYGYPEEGLDAIKHAGKLNPLKPFLYVWAEAQSHYLLGNFSKAALLFEQVKLSNPQFSGAHKMLAATYIALGKQDDAEWAAEELLLISPNFSLKSEKSRTPYLDQPVLTRYIESLEKAGIE